MPVRLVQRSLGVRTTAKHNELQHRADTHCVIFVSSVSRFESRRNHQRFQRTSHRVAVRDRRTGDCIVDQTLRLQNLPKLFRVDDDATAVSKNNTVMIKFIEVFRNLLTRGTDKCGKQFVTKI